MRATQVVNVRNQKCDLYVGRGVHTFEPSPWGNPYKLVEDTSEGRQQALEQYEDYLRSRPHLAESIRGYRGQAFGCWCSPKPCHADLLAKIADMSRQRFEEWLRGEFNIIDRERREQLGMEI